MAGCSAYEGFEVHLQASFELLMVQRAYLYEDMTGITSCSDSYSTVLIQISMMLVTLMVMLLKHQSLPHLLWTKRSRYVLV